MIHQQIKELFFSSVEHIVSDISQYAVHPDSDFKRSKKIPAQKLISFLVSQGSSSTRVEMLDFWGLDSSIPTASALSQQRAKLKPDALEAVFRHFNSTSMELPPASFMDSHYRSGAIRKKFWQTSTQKVTYALLIRQLLSITLNIEVMIHMSCPSVFYASLSALLHTSAS